MIALIKILKNRLRRSAPTSLASAAEIRSTFSRERMRIDRRGGAVSLLTLQIPEPNDPRPYYDRISRVLLRRLRNTDLAGLLDPRNIAIVLPDTDRNGAEKLVSDIRIASRFQPAQLPHSVSEYVRSGDDGNEHFGTNGSNGRDAEFPMREQPAEAVFCTAVPLWKRSMDIIGASVALLIFSPVLVVAAIFVRRTSPGPIFFVQQREGRGGRLFPMFKFRTMHVGAEQQQEQLRQFSEQDGPAFKMKNDPRLTTIGSFLRRTSIDELPQLFNVLRGEMSLVGPRPLPHAESTKCTGWQRRRLHVNPGMTCIWQVHARSSVSFVEWVRMDLEYVRNMSFLLDVKLLLLTFPVLLGKQQGAH